MQIRRYDKNGVPFPDDETYFKRSFDPADPTQQTSGTVTRTVNATSPESQQIVTNPPFLPAQVEVLAFADDDPTTFSQGKSIGVVNLCTASHAGAYDASKNLSINVAKDGNGWTGTILMNPNGFTINWTKVGQGLGLSLNYIAIK